MANGYVLEEAEEHIPDIDDTDGLDPEAEFEAWRLRELARIKRDKEAAVRREEERAEIERRRALPEEVRLKEDLERAQKLRDEKPKGSQKFLQKYWHKGAFHQESFGALLSVQIFTFINRTKRSSNGMTIQKQRSRLWMSLFCPKLCKSGILVNAVRPNTPIWWIKTLLFQRVDLVGSDPSNLVAGRDVSAVVVHI